MAKSSPLWRKEPAETHSVTWRQEAQVHFRSLPSNPMYIDFHVYRTVVQEYTKRHLTLSSDVLNAFQGIFNRFIDPGKTYLSLVHEAQAIPPRFLPMALLWYPISGSPRPSSRPSSSRVVGAAPSFSSWSWTSWHGPVTFLSSNSTLTRHTTLSNHLASGLPENLGSLIQAPGMPQPLLPAWNLLLSEKAMALFSHEDSSTLHLPKTIQSSEPRNKRPRPLGAPASLELYVPVLLGSAVSLSCSHIPGWWMVSLRGEQEAPQRESGWFRFDEEPAAAVHSYLAVVASDTATLGVLGVAKNDDETFRRVGVGWMTNRGFSNDVSSWQRAPGGSWMVQNILLL